MVGVPLNRPKSATAGKGFPATRRAINPKARKAAGLTAASHHRGTTRHRASRAPRSRSPGLPMVHAVTTTAAIAGPSNAG
jgi:hypothetical protein